jgi:hypothetical protein
MPVLILNTGPTFIFEQAPLSGADVSGVVPPLRREVSRPNESLATKIARLAAQWRRETGHLSSIERKVIHPAYQSIMVTGRPGIPFVLKELKERGGHWFWALHFMSGGVEFENAANVQELREAWLAWGKNEGYAF